ncbi:MAG: putative sulfate exporter family transporter, partial [Nocardioidaceae bacterium]|nr:putative sulfate exporter family transporter [Nocardioidaceae bacterium]
MPTLDSTTGAKAAIVNRAGGFAVPLIAAAAALGLSHLVPLVSALLFALALGAVLANVGLVGSVRMRVIEDAARWFLRLGVVFLGLQLPVQEIAAIGARGVLVIAATVSLTYGATRIVGRRLGLEEGIVGLVAAGFSICGAAAIAAVSDVARSRQR